MKKTQEQLKAEFLKELESTSTRRNDPKMIDYIKKEANYIVEMHDGGMFYIKKPRIETRFCFGYSDSPYNTDDYDRANALEQKARTEADYFLNENLEGINRNIEHIKEALDSENLRDDRGKNFYILKHHRNGDTEECKIRSFELLDRYEEQREKAYKQMNGNGLEIMTREDLENWLEGLEIVKAQFEKRLNTYLKRYGLSKLHTWTYWADE